MLLNYSIKADTTVTVSGNTDEWGSDDITMFLGLKELTLLKM